MPFGWDVIARKNAAYVQKKCFPAQLSAMDDVFAFLTDQAMAVSADEKSLDSLLMIAEELFVNIASYAYEKGGNAKIFCCTTNDPPCIYVLFTDRGIPYDPTKRTEEVAAASVETLTPGGLGIIMVRKMSDAMEYRYIDGENQLYIKKLLCGQTQ